MDTVFRVDGHESVLEPIRFLVAGPAEEVAIVGSISEKVRAFSASGEELSPFGRRGEGPGEFVFMTQVGWKGDSLWVFDSQNLRFTLFCPGKEGFHTYPAQMGVQPSAGTDLPSFGLMISIALRTDGSMLGTLGSPSSPDWVGEYKTIGLVGPEGTLGKIFARYQTPEGFIRVGDRGQSAGSSYPFEHSPKFDVSSDGSAAALALVEMRDDREGLVVVTRFDQSGDTVFTAALPFEGVRFRDPPVARR